MGKRPVHALKSKIYICLNSVCKPLYIDQTWSRDLGTSVEDVCWTTIWKNLDNTSKNPNHKLIHFRFLHRTYLTPRKLHLMKLISSPNCELCPNRDIGSFMHMYWHCPGVVIFWKMISTTLSGLLNVEFPYCPKPVFAE